jgi:hypothetical protein
MEDPILGPGFRKLDARTNNECFTDGKTLFVKKYATSASAAKERERTLRAQAFVHDQIIIPTIVDKDLPENYNAFTYIPTSGERVSDVHLYQAIQKLRLLHDESVREGQPEPQLFRASSLFVNLPPYFESLIREVTKTAQDKIRQMRASEGREIVLMHYDLHEENIYPVEADVALLDWEHSDWGIREVDVAYTVRSLIARGHGYDHALVEKAYGRSLDEGVISAFIPWILLKSYWFNQIKGEPTKCGPIAELLLQRYHIDVRDQRIRSWV